MTQDRRTQKSSSKINHGKILNDKKLDNSLKKLGKDTPASPLTKEELKNYIDNIDPKDTIIDDPNHIAFGVARAEPTDKQLNYGFDGNYNSDAEGDVTYFRYDIVGELSDLIENYLKKMDFDQVSRNIILSEVFVRLTREAGFVEGLTQPTITVENRENFTVSESTENKIGKSRPYIQSSEINSDACNHDVHIKSVIPSVPPDGKIYEKREKGQSAPDFIEETYKNWLTGEFTRADLRKLDPKAEMALRNWERSHGRAPLNLPTKKERNDRLLAHLGSGEKPEAAKLHDALRARKRRERVASS